MQTGELLIQPVGNGLRLTLVDIGSQANAQDGNNRRGCSNLRVEVDGVVGTFGRYELAEGAAQTGKTGNRGINTNTTGNHAKHNERNSHSLRSLVRRMVLVSLHILSTPEDAVVQTEHIECRHGGNTSHNPTHHGTVGKAGGDDLILRTETREERNTGNGQTRNEEGDMRDGHVLAQAAHHGHLVAVDGMDDAAGTKEQTGLEHGVGEQVEHTGHEAQLCVIVEHAVMTGQRNAKGHHHEGNLGNRREGQHALDVALGTSHGGSIESREDAHPDDNRHLRLCILHPQREHTGNLEHAGHNHRCGVDECRDRRRALHGVGQPDVQREHGRLTGTTDEHQHQSRGQYKACSGNSLGSIAGNERRRALAHHDVTGKREAERVRIVTEHQDTDEEEHIGKARHDECLLRSCNGGLQRIIEADEQIRADTHEFPEGIHLEDVGGQHQAEH